MKKSDFCMLIATVTISPHFEPVAAGFFAVIFYVAACVYAGRGK